MIGEVAEVGKNLKGTDLLFYTVLVGQLFLIFYLFKVIVRILNDLSKGMSTISEQIKILVSSAFNNRKD